MEGDASATGLQVSYDAPVGAKGPSLAADLGDTAADQPLSTLRGAGVAVDLRLAKRVLGTLIVLALAISSVVLFVSGAHQNAQASELRSHGVPVTVTLRSCFGQLGGSGSNVAGYSCTASFSLAGRRWVESFPWSSSGVPPRRASAYAVPSDPALVVSAASFRTERATARVFVLPSVLCALCIAALAAMASLRRRARRRRGGADPLPASPALSGPA